MTIPELPDELAGPGPEGALVLIDVDTQTAAVVARLSHCHAQHHLALVLTRQPLAVLWSLATMMRWGVLVEPALRLRERSARRHRGPQ